MHVGLLVLRIWLIAAILTVMLWGMAASHYKRKM